MDSKDMAILLDHMCPSFTNNKRDGGDDTGLTGHLMEESPPVVRTAVTCRHHTAHIT